MILPRSLGGIRNAPGSDLRVEETMIFPIESACSRADIDLLELATLEVRNLAGDIVELGSFQGASAFAMANMNPHKRVFACDLFGGNPYPGRMEFDYLSHVNFLEIAKRATFFPNLILVKGMHEETVPLLPVEKISFLHMDSDHYESHKVGLEILSPKVVIGGIIAFHDWSFPQVRQAVFDVLREDDWEFMLGRYEFLFAGDGEPRQGYAFLRRR